MTALNVTGLSYSYRNQWSRRKCPAVKDVSFSVAQGECFGFLGHNGAGKTTTLKCILGLTTTYTGDILVLGVPARSSASRRDVGYVPEQPYFYDHLTVIETLDMYGRLAGLSRSEVRVRAEAAATRVKIDGRLSAKMRSLSKGLTQRVALAQALVAAPRLLILDEPFSGLDPIGRSEFRDIFYEEKKKGTTIVISTHVLDDAERLCDRASIMANGELKGIVSLQDPAIEADGDFELSVEAPLVRAEDFPFPVVSTSHDSSGLLRVRVHGREVADRIIAFCTERSLRIHHFAKQGGSLESAFLRLVDYREDREVG